MPHFNSASVFDNLFGHNGVLKCAILKFLTGEDASFKKLVANKEADFFEALHFREAIWEPAVIKKWSKCFLVEE